MTIRSVETQLLARNVPANRKSRTQARLASLFLPVAFGILAALYSSAFLPESYRSDSIFIHSIIQRTAIIVPDSSYLHAAQYYVALGIGDSPVAVGAINFSLFAGALSVAVCKARLRDARTRLLELFSILLAVVYLSQYSKDSIVLYVTLAVLVCGRRRWGEAPIVLMMLVYALLFRKYWFLVVVLYLGFRYALPRCRKTRDAAILVGCAIFSLVLVFHYGLHYPIEHYRTIVNAVRSSSGTTVNTLIRTPRFGESIAGQFLTGIISLLILLFPVPLARDGGLQYLVFAIGIGAMWIVALSSFRRQLIQPQGIGLLELRAGSLALSMITVQCLFEPDYGSYIRHLSPLVPLLITVVGGAHARRQRSVTVSTRM